MVNDYDVLIVGGGLAGGSLALALRSSCLSVAVVEAVSDDRRQSSPAGNRALALSYGAKRLLDQLGLWAEVKSHAVPIKTIHISDRGHFGKTRLFAEDEGVDALGYVATARNLEDSISSALNASNLKRICPARLIGMQSGPESVCVSLKQGDEHINLNAGLVVGADGGNSTVRRLANISEHTRDYGQTALIAVVKPEIDPDFTAYERFTASGQLAFLPTEEGCCSVIWTQKSEDAESMATLSDPAFIQALQSAFGDWLGDLKYCGSRGAFPLKLVQADSMVSERTVLVGNAVHQLHPIAGQGLNLGLRDIAVLAEMLIENGGVAKDPGASDLLHRFAKIRKADHDRVIDFTDGLVNIFSNDWLPLAAVRNFGLLSLDCLPWAKHVIARYSMGLGGRMPRLTPSSLSS